MEDTLGDDLEYANYKTLEVLILVLMEDTLGETNLFVLIFQLASLNPCFNGRYSRRTML